MTLERCSDRADPDVSYRRCSPNAPFARLEMLTASITLPRPNGKTERLVIAALGRAIEPPPNDIRHTRRVFYRRQAPGAEGVLSHARLDRSAELPHASVNLDCDSMCRAIDGIGLIDARMSTSGGTSEASASLPLSRTKPPAVRSCPTASHLK